MTLDRTIILEIFGTESHKSYSSPPLSCFFMDHIYRPFRARFRGAAGCFTTGATLAITKMT